MTHLITTHNCVYNYENEYERHYSKELNQRKSIEYNFEMVRYFNNESIKVEKEDLSLS